MTSPFPADPAHIDRRTESRTAQTIPCRAEDRICAAKGD
jgi:hypothetical protein